MKQKSLIRQIAVLLTAQILLLGLMLCFFIGYSFFSARSEMELLTRNALEVYSTSLEGRIRRADDILKNIVLNENTALEMLCSTRESERFYAGAQIADAIRSVATSDDSAGILIVAENTYGACYDASGSVFTTLAQRQAITAYTRALLDADAPQNRWSIAQIGQDAYLCRSYIWNGHIVASYFPAQDFLDSVDSGDYQDMTLMLCDTGGTPWAFVGEQMFPWAAGAAPDTLPQQGYLVQQRTFAGGALSLCSYVSVRSIVHQLRYGMLALIGALAVGVGFSVLILAYMRQQVIRPMRGMTEELRQMQSGSREWKLTEAYGSAEFSFLRDAFNRLMEENIGLKLKGYRRQIELQDTELRCIRFQLRPHFFLNAMTTISSLSMQGKNEEIKRYIEALSKNIRYMFKSGLHTVPLREELQNVGYYLEMQELKYPGTVFYCLQQQPDTGEWPVPQMAIHTVLENEYKHAVSVGQMLTILVGVSVVEQDGARLLQIEIEDDGQGFPDEVIASFSAGAPAAEEDGTRVGLRSIRRMLQLMYERDDLMQLGSAEPHGARVQIRIPEKPLQEFQDRIQP